MSNSEEHNQTYFSNRCSWSCTYCSCIVPDGLVHILERRGTVIDTPYAITTWYVVDSSATVPSSRCAVQFQYVLDLLLSYCLAILVLQKYASSLVNASDSRNSLLTNTLSAVADLPNVGPDPWNRTYYPKGAHTDNSTKPWFIIDAEGQTLGRLATLTAMIIRYMTICKQHWASLCCSIMNQMSHRWY